MVPRYLVNFDLKDLEVVETDFVVVGAGVAGICVALNLSRHGKVCVLVKAGLKDCNTHYAEGGIAAAVSEKDSTENHFRDTLEAGAGLCNPEAVKVLVNDAPGRIKKLVELGVDFDKTSEGKPDLTKEGGHTARRILHAGGDIIGRVLRETLIKHVKGNEDIEEKEKHFVVDILTSGNEFKGFLALDREKGCLKVFKGKAGVLATGGAGQLYPNTSNPFVATGDGVAMAYRAGVDVMDLEMIQFHPTVSQLEKIPGFLLSESMRGEGAVLRNEAGERFMYHYHEDGELAPRDIVSRAIYQEIRKQKPGHVYLDATVMENNFLRKRFPNIYKTTLKGGIDITKKYIPVAPGAHYYMGGIKTNLSGQTSLKKLYACGEAACTGVHGANRLASNSLLEGIVYGPRVAMEAKKHRKTPTTPESLKWSKQTLPEKSGQARKTSLKNVRRKIQETMQENVGINRSQKTLKKAQKRLKKLGKHLGKEYWFKNGLETLNLLTLSRLVVKSSLIRTESRGAHYRVDYPEKNPAWEKRIVHRKEKKWRPHPVEFR